MLVPNNQLYRKMVVQNPHHTISAEASVCRHGSNNNSTNYICSQYKQDDGEVDNENDNNSYQNDNGLPAKALCKRSIMGLGRKKNEMGCKLYSSIKRGQPLQQCCAQP